jgi:hypothetical protein
MCEKEFILRRNRSTSRTLMIARFLVKLCSRETQYFFCFGMQQCVYVCKRGIVFSVKRATCPLFFTHSLSRSLSLSFYTTKTCFFFSSFYVLISVFGSLLLFDFVKSFWPSRCAFLVPIFKN